MRINYKTIIIAISISLLPSSAFCYLLDTGEPTTYLISYDLNLDRPAISIEFTNSETWQIGSIAGFFTASGVDSYLQATIWKDNGNIPGDVLLQSDPTAISGFGWLGVSNLNWELLPGTWWFGFTYFDGGTTDWWSNSIQFPHNPVWEAQYYKKTDGSFGWISRENIYNFPLRIDGEGGAPVPEPATLLLFSLGLAGFAGSRMKKRK